MDRQPYRVTENVDAFTRIRGRRVVPGETVHLSPKEAAGELLRGVVAGPAAGSATIPLLPRDKPVPPPADLPVPTPRDQPADGPVVTGEPRTRRRPAGRS